MRRDAPSSPDGVRILFGKGDTRRGYASSTSQDFEVVRFVLHDLGRGDEAREKGELVLAGHDLAHIETHLAARIAALLDGYEYNTPFDKRPNHRAFQTVTYEGRTLEVDMVFDRAGQTIVNLIEWRTAVQEALAAGDGCWLVFRRGMTERGDCATSTPWKEPRRRARRSHRAALRRYPRRRRGPLRPRAPRRAWIRPPERRRGPHHGQGLRRPLSRGGRPESVATSVKGRPYRDRSNGHVGRSGRKGGNTYRPSWSAKARRGFERCTITPCIRNPHVGMSSLLAGSLWWAATAGFATCSLRFDVGFGVGRPAESAPTSMSGSDGEAPANSGGRGPGRANWGTCCPAGGECGERAQRVIANAGRDDACSTRIPDKPSPICRRASTRGSAPGTSYAAETAPAALPIASLFAGSTEWR